MRGLLPTLSLSLLPLLAGCAPSKRPPAIVSARDLPTASVAPRVRQVFDLGTSRLDGSERLPAARSDGLAVIGELVHIVGDHFGRQPRVSVGGQSAEQIARTAGGGIIARVPWGARAGRQPFEVRTARGQDATVFTVRRYALATIPPQGKIYALEVERDGVRVVGEPLSLPGAHLVRYCADGQTALVSGLVEPEEPSGGSPGGSAAKKRAGEPTADAAGKTAGNAAGSAAADTPAKPAARGSAGGAKQPASKRKIKEVAAQSSSGRKSVPGSDEGRTPEAAPGILPVEPRPVARGTVVVAIVDMVAPGGPRLHDTQRLPGKEILALTAADKAPLAAALTDSHIVFLDTSDPQAPARYRALPLPEELRSGELVAAEMDAKGKLLAAVVRHENRVILYDIERPDAVRRLASTPVLPEKRVPLLRDLRFSPDSSTLWVLSGENAESLARGRFPLRLTAVKIEVRRTTRTSSFGMLSIWRSLDVHRSAPVGLAVARGQPLASGGTILVPPKSAAVFVTVHDSAAFKLRSGRLESKQDLQQAAASLRDLSALGSLVRTDISGLGKALFTSPALLGPVDVSSDSQVVLAAGTEITVREDPPGIGLVYGVTSCRVFGTAKPVFVPLERIEAESGLPRELSFGDIRMQP